MNDNKTVGREGARVFYDNKKKKDTTGGKCFQCVSVGK